MNRLLLIVSILLINFSFSQQFQLSPQAEISVLTIGQGTNLNDAFGHSAYRIKDKAYGIDVVYDYGRYDFDTPNFYLKFAQGKLNYLIGKRNFSDFYKIYRFYDRTMEEQVLNLSQEQKQKIYNYLVNNYKPENQKYLYDFFYDNCATKIRDVVNISSSNSIAYNKLKDQPEKSFRDMIHENVGQNTWGSFGIDIALGSLIDKTTTKEEQLFLPKYVYLHFENATINNQPLVKSSSKIYTSKHKKEYKKVGVLNPLLIMSLISVFIIYITYRDFKTKKRTKWLDAILFSITGLAGVILLFLWFGTDHGVTGYNYNLLWAFPLNLLLISQVFKSKVKHWFRGYLKFLIIMLCLMTLHWIIGVQVFALGLLPILIALFIRYLYLVKYFKN
ncbi:MAG: DUF4105 domain-containing protein [Winogradskyella sp.]|uniref:lipoprotein N-acyltransferase Lnb domain-containing protein n=1 Tax=Winogradskyella sp. TaxID=1883156 RepID=UPI000F3C22B8|nr:DUF4105 domain-containing protein [Winogradskyella sp.]RNC86899.1 MAG: DUF4105 domain-containing protein [Winogradskyella sp.]